MKTQLVIKLGLTVILLAQLLGCAKPTKKAVSEMPIVVAASPIAPSAVSQEAALDKNEAIIDKPAPAQNDVLSLLAKITPAQLARIAQALKTTAPDAQAQANITQATPKIRAFVERLSCIRQYNDGGSTALQNMAAPGVSFKFFVPPMHGMKAHAKSSCISVNAIQLKHLSVQGAAAIQIKVLYLAEDSGETTTSNHEINKSNKGVWWFTR